MAAAALLLLLLAAVVALTVHAYIPTAYIDIRRTHSNLEGVSIEYLFRIEATESDFAPHPPKGHRSYTSSPLSQSSSNKLPPPYSSYPIVPPPPSDPLLCNEATGSSNYINPVGTVDLSDMGYLYNRYVYVPRGSCSFEAKTRSAQRLGAAGILIYNTLHSRYSSIDQDKEYTNSPNPDYGNIEWPSNLIDYECGDNQALNNMGLRFQVPSSRIYWNPPPYNEINDNSMTGWVDDGNLCAVDYVNRLGGTLDDYREKCPSERCLLTGQNVSDDGSIMEACCAWDIPIAMGSDGEEDGDAVPDIEEEEIVIHAYFITMEDAQKLSTVVDDSLDSANLEGMGNINYISAVPYAKWYPDFHFSTVMLWTLAVFTVWISCYKSASEYRMSWKVISDALNEGLLVLSRNSVAPSPGIAAALGGGGGARQRADTDETVDLADDVLEEIEMPVVANDENNSATAAETVTESTDNHDLTFQIDDDDEGNGDSNGGENTVASTDVNSTASSPSDANNHADPAASNEATEQMETIDTTDSSDQGGENTSSEVQQQQQSQTQTANAQTVSTMAPTAAERRVELNTMHAVIFVVCASAVLFVLFTYNLFMIVSIVYGLGGSACMNVVLMQPVLTRFLPEKYLQKGAPSFLQYCGYARAVDVFSSWTSYAIGLAWIFIALSHVNPLLNTYYWVIQDVFGVCYCIYVMGIIHINTIMVGTILLVLVFFYDIFFVFLSPYIFGTSVMNDVATGGTTQGAALFCYKYPSDSRCSGSQSPLPMMLVFPWVLDYRNGFSMIGLGDIVLPGLLISFAARYDGAKFLTRKVSEVSSSGRARGDNTDAGEGNDSNGVGASGDMEYTPTVTRKQALMGSVTNFFKSLKKGYFGPMMVAYAVGLTAAYGAVYGMQMGQPVLLYLVPACLGTMIVLGLRKRQLSDLWQGPKVILKANRVVSMANKIPQLRAAAATAPRNNLPEATVV
eukprot:scaffold48541_cov63-Cyclotella_meneghiniana.AAC.2